MVAQLSAFSDELDAMKYRLPGESFEEAGNRVADALKDSPEHFRAMKDIFNDQRFLVGGRVRAAMGAPRAITPWNCFVMDTIPDSMEGIMDVAKDAAMTMRQGGGVGYDFSPIRGNGRNISTLQSPASGPVSFMHIYDAVCHTIASAGKRRGAQMAVLRVDHPDIEEFIRVKRNSNKLTAFNVSIGITDEFMRAVLNDEYFDLRQNERTYKSIRATALWDEVMRSSWDWAEPGVLFIDTINDYNNLWYIEDISATNPCGEQPLPPNGACLLGSFNLTRYIKLFGPGFDFDQFTKDIPDVIRAMDNINDRGMAPLTKQYVEIIEKRRMGIGMTGVANALEALGNPYGTPGYLEDLETVCRVLRDEAYRASIELAKEKGPFPAFDAELYCQSKFVMTLPADIQEGIAEFGIRNSHLLSYAPTGTISLTANNVSGSMEPTFSKVLDRTVQTEQGERVERLEDYGVRVFGNTPKTAMECSAEDHLKVLEIATKYVDSAVSKTCNVSPDMPWDDFKDLYVQAWKSKCKGITTFNPGGKRYGILNAVDGVEAVEEVVEACFIDPETGQAECS